MKEEDNVRRNRWIALCLAGCLALALSACGSQTAVGTSSLAGGSGSSAGSDSAAGAVSPAQSSASSQEEQETLVEYTVEGLGIFRLPEGFTQDAGTMTEPLPMQYATLEKDGYYIQANRMGKNAYEISGVALPADVEEYSTRSGVQNSVPEGTVFNYDEYGSYAAQFTQEDGQICYYVLLQGEESFGSVFLTAAEDRFDLETVALWLSGSQLE